MLNREMSAMQIGERGTVTAMQLTGTIQRRLLDIGLIAGTKVECVLKSPSGDPSAYKIRGAVIALRREDSERIFYQ